MLHVESPDTRTAPQPYLHLSPYLLPCVSKGQIVQKRGKSARGDFAPDTAAPDDSNTTEADDSDRCDSTRVHSDLHPREILSTKRSLAAPPSRVPHNTNPTRQPPSFAVTRFM